MSANETELKQAGQAISEGVAKQMTYECCFCDRKLSSKRNLRQHEYIHIGVKPFTCPKCGKAFAQKGTLARHTITHTDEQFECQFCGKNLSTKSSLRVHELIHIGTKRHICNVCGKAYVQKVNLQYHLRKTGHSNGVENLMLKYGSKQHERSATHMDT